MSDYSENSYDPMGARAQKNMQDPAALVQQGIAHLNDPDNGLSYEQKMEAIVPLLQAKHFGGPPPPNVGSGYKPGAEGAIQVPNSQNKGLLGFLNNILGGSSAAQKLGILNSTGAASAGGYTATGALSGLNAGAAAGAATEVEDLAVLL